MPIGGIRININVSIEIYKYNQLGSINCGNAVKGNAVKRFAYLLLESQERSSRKGMTESKSFGKKAFLTHGRQFWKECIFA